MVAKRQEFDIMAALANSMQGQAPQRDNYVYSEAENQAALQAVDKNIAAKKAKGVQESTRVDRRPIPVEYSLSQEAPAVKETPAVKEIPRAKQMAMKQASVPSSPVPEAPQVNKFGLTPQGVAETDNAKVPQQESNFDWGDILVGATPVLAGLLMGEPAVGFNEGGKAIGKLYDERNKRYDTSLASQRKLASASQEKLQRGRFQRVPIERDGLTYMDILDTATGEVKPTGEIAGYRQTLTKDPTTDELIKFRGSGSIDNIRGVKPSEYTVKQQKDLEGLNKRVLSDKRVIAGRESIDAAGRALSLLRANNPVSDRGLQIIFPRLFGEVGNLTAAEQAATSGSSAFPRVFSRLKERWETGRLTDEDRSDLMEVARVMEAYSKRSLGSAMSSYKKYYEDVKGYDPSKAIDPFQGGTEYSPEAVLKSAKSKDPKRGKPEFKFIDKGNTRYIYKLTPEGNYKPDRTERLK